MAPPPEDAAGDFATRYFMGLVYNGQIESAAPAVLPAPYAPDNHTNDGSDDTYAQTGHRAHQNFPMFPQQGYGSSLDFNQLHPQPVGPLFTPNFNGPVDFASPVAAMPQEFPLEPQQPYSPAGPLTRWNRASGAGIRLPPTPETPQAPQRIATSTSATPRLTHGSSKEKHRSSPYPNKKPRVSRERDGSGRDPVSATSSPATEAQPREYQYTSDDVQDLRNYMIQMMKMAEGKLQAAKQSNPEEFRQLAEELCERESNPLFEAMHSYRMNKGQCPLESIASPQHDLQQGGPQSTFPRGVE